MANDCHVLDLLPGYVLDCLDEDELIRVSEHLAICPIHQALQTAIKPVSIQVFIDSSRAAVHQANGEITQLQRNVSWQVA